MLHVLFGVVNRDTAPRQYIHNIDGYFDGYFEEEWMKNELAKKAIKEIDKSALIAPKIIESPVLDTISHEWLSGGTKQLIMMYSVSEVVYDGDNLGDNCWPLLLELSKDRDLAISLSYYPVFEWKQGAVVHIINSDEIVDKFRQFNLKHIEIGNADFEFSEVDWRISIDTTRFELEDFDF